MALIVGGKMPTCCGLCCECLGGGSDAYYCNRAKRQISDIVPPYDKRMEWCPIIGEIPDEHGDLIDRHGLLEKLRELIDEVDVLDGETDTRRVVKLVEESPTILPSNRSVHKEETER